MEELLHELKPYDYKIFFSIGNTLPDCFNMPIEEALKDESFTHILICEDDMIIPKNILGQMFKEKYPVVALDYPFKNDGEATTLHDPDGMALFTGTGFMLIERWVFNKMPRPIFYTDTAWDMMLTKNHKLIVWPRDVSKIKTYGLHDVNFGITMWTNGIPIYPMPKTAGQRKLKAKGKANTNNGIDQIYDLTVVWRDNTAKTTDTNMIQAYLDRLHQTRVIEILDKCPDNVEYIDGQATLREGKQIII